MYIARTNKYKKKHEQFLFLMKSKSMNLFKLEYLFKMEVRLQLIRLKLK